MKEDRVVAIAACFAYMILVVQARSTLDYACDPRKSEASCLLGCLACFEHYGGQMYNMASCCQECRETKSLLIDDGQKCSQRFIKVSWMRRFGRDVSSKENQKIFSV